MRNKSKGIEAIFLEDYYLYVLLSHARHGLHKLRERELDRCGLSSRQAAVLSAVYTLGDEATPAEIARWHFRESNTISELLGRMEKDGFITKIKNQDRRNQIKVVLTPKGLRSYKQTAKYRFYHKVFSCLSEEERRQLQLSLWKILDKSVKELGIKFMLPFPPREAH